jgi:hypothetical protein
VAVDLECCWMLLCTVERGLLQGCHNGRPTLKITVRTSACVRVYPEDAVLPADGFLRSVNVVKRPHGHKHIRTDEVISLPPPSLCTPRSPCANGLLRPHGRAQKNKIKIKINNKKFGCWLLERRGKKCSIFGFQSPRSPSSTGPGLRRQSREKKKVFLA